MNRKQAMQYTVHHDGLDVGHPFLGLDLFGVVFTEG